MKLADLQPQFVRYETRVETYDVMVEGQTRQLTGPRQYTRFVPSFADAQGVWFLCPKCFAANGNSDIGVHWVDVSFAGRGVQPDQGSHGTNGHPTRWAFAGDSFANLTTTPSVLIVGGCGWHGFITNGEIV